MAKSADTGPTKQYRRFHHLIAREVDGEIFIADDATGRIHSLGDLGSAIWRLLDGPRTEADCRVVFKVAFPDDDSRKIERLVATTLAELKQKGVIY